MCKKFISVLVCIMLTVPFNVASAEFDDLSLSAQSAVVICADTGKIIYGKDEHSPRPMASTTKIMTALLALEAADTEDVNVTITDKMVPVEGSSMYLKVGQVLPLSSLAKGMLTVSGNDAANSVAITLGGSVDGFVDMMNKKAKQIGLKNTYFETPSGLDKGNHHSTAYDMALLGAFALENKSFYDISSKKRVEVPFIEPDEIRTLYNENRMLKRYDGCIGVKTGFTKKSGRCLVSAAERNNTRLVAVTLNAGDDWNDHEKLLDYGFSKVETVSFNDKDGITIPLVGGKVNDTILIAKDKISLTLPKNEKGKIERIVEVPSFLYAPLKQGQVVGKIKYKLNGNVVTSNDLIVSEDKDVLKKEKNIFSKIFEFFISFFN